MDWRRKRADPAPLHIEGDCVERVSSFKFLGVHVANNLTWSTNTSAVVRKAQQRQHFLRLLRKCDVNVHLLRSFNHSTIESVLTYTKCRLTFRYHCNVMYNYSTAFTQYVIAFHIYADMLISNKMFISETDDPLQCNSGGRKKTTTSTVEPLGIL